MSVPAGRQASTPKVRPGWETRGQSGKEWTKTLGHRGGVLVWRGFDTRCETGGGTGVRKRETCWIGEASTPGVRPGAEEANFGLNALGFRSSVESIAILRS